MFLSIEKEHVSVRIFIASLMVIKRNREGTLLFYMLHSCFFSFISASIPSRILVYCGFFFNKY